MAVAEQSKLPSHHGEEPEGRAETTGKGLELESLALEGHLEEPSGP